jgi:adenine phosphoribosyltransferase
MNLTEFVRTIPDYPKPGIMFRDVTTLFRDATAYGYAVNKLADHFKHVKVDAVAGIEARGFVIGASLATTLSLGFIPIRKAGKLPSATFSQEYDLEYGRDCVEVHQDAVTHSQRILVVDDLLATGGTADATIGLLRQAGAIVEHAGFLIDLPDLGGRSRLLKMGVESHALMTFAGH